MGERERERERERGRREYLLWELAYVIMEPTESHDIPSIGWRIREAKDLRTWGATDAVLRLENLVF
jgi:hypothetical protein